MPEPLGDDLERLAGGQRRGGVAVPDAVQGDRRQAGVADQGGEPLGDVLGVEDLAVLAGEDQAGVGPGRPPGQALLELPDAVGLQGGRGEVSPSGITSRTGQTHRTPEPWGPGSKEQLRGRHERCGPRRRRTTLRCEQCRLRLPPQAARAAGPPRSQPRRSSKHRDGF